MCICSVLAAPWWCFLFVFVPPCYCPAWPFNPFPLHQPIIIHILFKGHSKCHSLWETACSVGINHIFHCIPTPLCFGLFYSFSLLLCILFICVSHPPQKHTHAYTLWATSCRQSSYLSQHKDQYPLYTLLLLLLLLSHLSCVRLFATTWTGAYQAPLPRGFSRQEYWSGLPLHIADAS